MALYEITFLTKEETDPGVREAIEALGGAITEESSLGRRKLAYPINKETQAVYTTYVFDADSTAMAELNRRLGLNQGVMRFLIVNKPVVQRQDKEVTKAVREAIEAAEKLDDTLNETPAAPAVEAPVAEEPAVEEVVAETETVEVAEEAPVAAEEAPAEEEKPAKKTRTKKPETAVEATEEDRLKALEDKLSDILKD